MNWKELKEFSGIDLNDSFVLSWNHDCNNLVFELVASIWPDSKHYEQPKNNEYTCYKPAKLSFNNFVVLSGLLEMSDVTPFTDADNEKDYGNIDSLVSNDSGYTVEGEFGEVSISGGSMRFEIET